VRRPRDTLLSAKVGTKFRLQVAVAQSVQSACRPRATELACFVLCISLVDVCRFCIIFAYTIFRVNMIVWGTVTKHIPLSLLVNGSTFQNIITLIVITTDDETVSHQQW
jgi:hypothetical protein